MKDNNQKDNIIPVDVRKQYMSDMARYSLYVLFERYVPEICDGLIPVQRRILYAMLNDVKCVSKATKRKSLNTVGTVSGLYHPHGDCLRGDTIVMTSDKTFHLIEDLYNDSITEFEAYGINEQTLEVETVQVHDLRIGQYTDEIYHLMLTNGNCIKCTGNHPIMVEDGSYVQAKDITEGTVLLTKRINQTEPKKFIKGYLDGHYTEEDLYGSVIVINIYTEHVNQEPMYDFTVDTTHNMLFPVIGFGEAIEDMAFICMHNSSVYGAMQTMTNFWEIKVPLLNYDSSSGSIQGGPQAAARYTECYLSQFTMDAIFADMLDSRMCVEWDKTFDGKTVEPLYLPVRVPLLLINGRFDIAIGRRIEVPPHSLNDVIDATIDVMHNPNAKVVLIPDPCQKCEIVEADWKKISNTGFGYYKQRGIVDITQDDKGIYTVHMLSMPDFVKANSVVDNIQELIKDNKLPQVADIQDHSKEDALDIWLVLKKGADPEYVRQVLYKHTKIQDTKRINMEVIDQNEIKRVSYKAYIVAFLEQRRNVKFRLYNSRLQKVETRLHMTEIFIQILESGDVENIIHAIRNQKPSEEAQLIDWLCKKLKITDLQAKYILNTEIKKLSKGNLNRYKEERKNLLDQRAAFIKKITVPELIDQEIEQELLEIKAKYGKPRMSIIISEGEASNIPQGTFKIVVYESGFIKKTEVTAPIKTYKGDNPKCVIVGDNDKDMLLFDEMGKVFRLPIHKIPFTDKNSPGTDVRMMLKKLTSNIASIMYLPILTVLANKKSKYFIIPVTKMGLIKRIDLDDVINTTPSGILYTKLNKDDFVKDIVIANIKSDIVIYTKTKALRVPIESIPYLKRSTLGSSAIRGNEPIEGISVITSETKDIVIVTAKGRFNRIQQSALERSTRGKAGSRIIKLSKGDEIKNVFTCSTSTTVRCVHNDGTVTDITTSDVPMGSSVSPGEKLTKEIIKAELIATNV